MLATELSGFALADDMSDTLVVAVSQSGTTTDTNRTVDLVRARGALVVSVVNRRNSDLVDKSDGVLYTSDGRDVEMSVASTKAFYAQVAAGFLLAVALADVLGCADPHRRIHELLGALRQLPDAMVKVLGRREDIAGGRGPAGSAATLLGGGRQRAQPHRRLRGPHQAVRALLQVDRLRRHRGQEAHRPVLGAADPRLRRRPVSGPTPMTWPRRWPSTGPTRRRRS